MTQTYYKPGAWNADCAMCGRSFKNSELRKNWKGFWVCERDWEPRHPQDYVRGVPDGKPPAWVQYSISHPDVAVCTPNGASAVPGQGVPGCMIPGYLHPFFDPTITET